MTGVAFVTGAAGDIGRASCLRLAADGWALVVADHPGAGAGLHETLGLVEAAGVKAIALPFDVTDAAAVDEAVAACVEQLGPPSALLNNAGKQGAFTPIQRYPLDDLREIIEVNVIGAFQVLRSVASAMVTGGAGGAIVNVASMAGVSGAPNMAAYSASKAAIIGLTRSAAKDLAPHRITVNSISPAFIGPGAMWDRQVQLQADAASQYFPADPAQVEALMIGSIPLRRVGSIEEVASVVSFLLGPDASYVNGLNVEISGGAA
jgi:NAD(P)-dependent dehydrogenase (short-subunit alcohol dehydrogenase family)